jgi:hypothetical protein
MVVKLECASVTDFDPDPAIDRWPERDKSAL